MSGDVKWECPECGRTTELPEGVTPGWHYRRTGGAHADNTCTAPMRVVSKSAASKSEWVWSKETHVCTHECLQFCRIWDRACMQLAVNTLVRIIWTVVPLAAAEQRGRDDEQAWQRLKMDIL